MNNQSNAIEHLEDCICLELTDTVSNVNNNMTSSTFLICLTVQGYPILDFFTPSDNSVCGNANTKGDVRMKDFGRMFELSSVKEGWSDGTLSPVSVFYIAVRNDCLVFKTRSGRCPTGEEFISASLRLMKAYEAAEGPIERPRRDYPTRFLVELDRDSGSEVCYLEEEVDQGYPVKRKILSTSWGGKAELVGGTSIYDLLDFLVANGRIVVETATSGQQFYRFLEGRDGFDSMIIIPPRDTAHEKGWALPGESPRLVVNREE